MNMVSGIGGTAADFWKVNRMTQDLLQRRDVNGDKALTAEEFGGPQEDFTKIDRNSDSRLDAVELNKAAMGKTLDQRTAELINSRDQNSDGMLTAEEMNVPAEVFSTIDKDSSGTADMSELNAAYLSRHAANQYQQAMNATPAPQATAVSSVIA